jgi:hypothetical protein
MYHWFNCIDMLSGPTLEPVSYHITSYRIVSFFDSMDDLAFVAAILFICFVFYRFFPFSRMSIDYLLFWLTPDLHSPSPSSASERLGRSTDTADRPGRGYLLFQRISLGQG